MSFEDFTEMPVWQHAFKLLTRIYYITKDFPSEEKFGLVSDMRRAANSIVHNIAEGYGRTETKDKTRFYKISRGSGYELISQLLVSHELRYLVNKTELKELIDAAKNIAHELNSLIKALESKQSKP
ncbi:MAG: four helix bundle protein [bacterium]